MIIDMKKFRILATSLAALAMLAVSSNVSARVPVINSGVGPVVAASQSNATLPKKAVKFINKYYGGVPVYNVEVEYPSKNYEVTLANGVEIEFTSKGKIVEIEAPDNECLSEKVVKAVLPRETYRDLSERNLQTMVEGIKHDKFGYKVDLNDVVYDEARYTGDGFLVALYEE